MNFYQREMGSSVIHTTKLAETLNKQREEHPELCDLTICTDGKVGPERQQCTANIGCSSDWTDLSNGDEVEAT